MTEYADQQDSWPDGEVPEDDGICTDCYGFWDQPRNGCDNPIHQGIEEDDEAD